MFQLYTLFYSSSFFTFSSHRVSVWLTRLLEKSNVNGDVPLVAYASTDSVDIQREFPQALDERKRLEGEKSPWSWLTTFTRPSPRKFHQRECHPVPHCWVGFSASCTLDLSTEILQRSEEIGPTGKQSHDKLTCTFFFFI